jgi:O-glycosyl hydrolase
MRNYILSKYLLFIFSTVLLFGCKGKESGNEKQGLLKDSVEKFMINVGENHQTIDNFGASDAWSIQYIGLCHEKKKQQKDDRLLINKK